MSEQGVDLGRRRFLTVATAVTGGVGVALVATPFMASMKPSARAQALGAAVNIDISKLEAGAMLKAEWRGKAIYVVKRTPSELQRITKLGATELRDPNSEEPQQPAYARNEFRSIKDDILVLVAVCTHLGCAPEFRPEVAPEDLGSDWSGGFFCACHGSKFDLAGRVFKGVPAPLNLPVPPHRYLADTVILIGDDTGSQA
ncbi:MAG: ubiquinol-cytochrome c reductase iron-sulfur subunit [Gammaproteobacteria bacterium]|nr:ubiquinol-cytochrome c reductase iron-sulfur subunit [Gammaproteobacteria bacterium]